VKRRAAKRGYWHLTGEGVRTLCGLPPVAPGNVVTIREVAPGEITCEACRAAAQGTGRLIEPAS